MTAANHVITGFVIAAAVHNPWISLPVAIATHFVLDALPHFGVQDETAALSRLRWLLPLDVTVAASLLIGLAAVGPPHWQVIALGGILCASPDLMHIPRYVRFLRTGDAAPDKDWLSRFHTRIQWCERLWGKWVELAWAGIFLLALVKLV